MDLISPMLDNEMYFALLYYVKTTKLDRIVYVERENGTRSFVA